jgi:hypothetical protein
VDWPEQLDPEAQQVLISGGLCLWAVGVRKQVQRACSARKEYRRDGLLKIQADELPDLALLLEALRIARNLALSAVRIAPDATTKQEYLRALGEFDRAVPRIEQIRSVSHYFGKFIIDARREVKGGTASHRDFSYRVIFDDETLDLSEYVIVLSGIGEISILACPDAADTLAKSIHKALGQPRKV